MKKKFSTFFAAMAFLWCAVFAVNAQSDQLYLNKAELENLYQIAIGGQTAEVLAIDGTGTLVVVDATSLPQNINLANTLWCVEIESQDQGINPVYKFLNKATGDYLSVTMQGLDDTTLPVGSGYSSTDVKVGGEIEAWKFSDKFNNNQIETQMPLYAFYKSSYVVGLHIVDNGPAGKSVRLAKQQISNNTVVADDISSSNANAFTELTLQTSRPLIYLSAEEFNSVIGNQEEKDGVELMFKEELNINPFEGQKLFAADAAVYEHPLTGAVDASADYLYIYTEDDYYLMADTSYYNELSDNRYVRYKWVDLSKSALAKKKFNGTAVEYLDNEDTYRGQYMFRMAYYPTPNKLEIEVAAISYVGTTTRDNKLAWAYWPKELTSTSTGVAIERNQYIRKQSYAGDSKLTVASIDAASTTVARGQNIEVGFADFKGCTAGNNKTSVGTDLYVITDGKGKYLAVPIHQVNSNSDYYGGRNAEWVTLERNVNPWTMPAFQWVVEKTQTAEILKESSPIKITNREYGDVVINNYQLYTDKGSELAGVELKKENFKPDTLGVKADPYVGYRMFDNDSLLIAGYTFKYLHELGTQDLYLKIGGDEVDSVLYVSNENKLSFALDTVATEDLRYDKTYYSNGSDIITEEFAFGYTPLRTVNNEEVPLAGWSKLERRVYTLKVKGAAEPAYVVLDDENRYAITKYNSWDQNNNPDDSKYPVRFYLKANNEKDGEIYYALIDATTNYDFLNNFTLPNRVYDTPKGGVDDNSLMLKSNELKEKRTSAFAIEIDDTPLYRRFANDPAQGAYANGDGPDTMRFYEKYRHEYLQMEANPNFMEAGIDFLGINAKSEAKGGLAFQVDSAWIGRGLGYIKPQYLISIDRNDQPAVAPIECPEEFHGNAPDGTPYDKWTCPHATKGTPGFNRGRYLINFEFQGYGAASTATEKELAENKYMWKKFYRAGFVDAVHVGDSLYILRDEFAGITNAHIDTAKIKAAEAAWRKADKKEDRSKLSYYIIDLSGDKHTFATWSMRYVEPENTAINKTFLMESMCWNNGNERNWIAPTYGAWLKMQNGCLVLSKYDSKFTVETAGDDALIFDVEYVEEDELATDDEVIAESSVVVIAGQGNVTVKNAAGKKVAISNILGQTVANTVVTSDNATIAVPAGVVVVAVEGESAVKAIVK